MNKKIVEKLNKILIENGRIKISEEDIFEDSNLINDFGYDSLLIIKLIVEIEEEFNINFEDEELNSTLFLEYKCLVKLVETKVDNIIKIK